MDAIVVIATKGRAEECCVLVSYIAAQTERPVATIFVGVDDSDIEGIASQPNFGDIGGHVEISSRVGLTSQRNFGVSLARKLFDPARQKFVVFFDDDFRPDRKWIENAGTVFKQHPKIFGVTGFVIADGVKGAGIEEEDAKMLISGKLPPQKNWAQSDHPMPVDSLYGCNMAIREEVFSNNSFDERLPLYGWQEDRDFTYKVKSFGDVILHPGSRGVHLGSKSGRISGVRMGYSQIANLLYMKNKKSVSTSVCAFFVGRALAANVVKSILGSEFIDYPGRLKGNLIAIWDVIRNRAKPENILNL